MIQIERISKTASTVASAHHSDPTDSANQHGRTAILSVRANATTLRQTVFRVESTIVETLSIVHDDSEPSDNKNVDFLDSDLNQMHADTHVHLL